MPETAKGYEERMEMGREFDERMAALDRAENKRKAKARALKGVFHRAAEHLESTARFMRLAGKMIQELEE